MFYKKWIIVSLSVLLAGFIILQTAESESDTPHLHGNLIFSYSPYTVILFDLDTGIEKAEIRLPNGKIVDLSNARLTVESDGSFTINHASFESIVVIATPNDADNYAISVHVSIFDKTTRKSTLETAAYDAILAPLPHEELAPLVIVDDRTIQILEETPHRGYTTESFEFDILIVDPTINRHRDIQFNDGRVSGATINGKIYDPDGTLMESFTHTTQQNDGYAHSWLVPYSATTRGAYTIQVDATKVFDTGHSTSDTITVEFYLGTGDDSDDCINTSYLSRCMDTYTNDNSTCMTTKTTCMNTPNVSDTITMQCMATYDMCMMNSTKRYMMCTTMCLANP